MDRVVVEELVRALKGFNVTQEGMLGAQGDFLIVRLPIKAIQDAAKAIAAAESELNKPVDMGR